MESDMGICMLKEKNKSAYDFIVLRPLGNTHEVEFKLVLKLKRLSHRGLAAHLCVRELGLTGCGNGFFTCSAPSHYLYQCCLIVNGRLENNFMIFFIKIKIRGVGVWADVSVKSHYGEALCGPA